MSDQNSSKAIDRVEGQDGRRRQLRALILSAADTARETRRIRQVAARVARPVGRAVRERVSMLVNAAV
ncbi:MAG TPA: hypothetical protein VN706_05260 [Gemmatimonadaceae bacterium]|nr:hypothetical protein [Gemmatimonadaceae bacterium]